MKKSSAAFRVDASHMVGMGHIMHCITIAKALPKKTPIYFIVKESESIDSITTLVEGIGAKLIKLPCLKTWLDECYEVIKITKIIHAKILITDLCHGAVLEIPDYLWSYHKALREHSDLLVISIEDVRLPKFSSHAVILYNALIKSNCVDKMKFDTLVLSGTKYFIASPEMANLAKNKQLIREKATNILICIGGSDNQHITLKVLVGLKASKQAFKVRVVLGFTFNETYLKKIVLFCKKDTRFECRTFSDEWGAHLLWADLVIVGEGTVKFDPVLMGTPAALISQFDHSSRPMLDFLSLGVVRYLGPGPSLSGSAICNAIMIFLDDFETRKNIATRCKYIFDGLGVSRIIKKIVSHYPQAEEICCELD